MKDYQPIANSENNPFDVQAEPGDLVHARPPCAQRLIQLCSMDKIYWWARFIGAGSMATGFTSLTCQAMMDDSNKQGSATTLILVGALLNLAGSLPGLHNLCGEERWNFIKHCCAEAIAPALTATTVYMALAHDVI